jgi:NAD(P)-dependent dehydrogenase (short-subunit alcohol dehydrogenase family)
MSRQVCAIIGAGDGLGQSLARKFAANGFDIALMSRSETGSAAARAAAREAAPDAAVEFYKVDAMQPETVEQGVRAAASAIGPIDVLIYNVRGGMNAKPPLEMTYQEMRDIYEIEVVGAHAAARAVMPAMIERRAGTVIYSSATAALRGSGTNPLYAIGKFGLRALAQSLAKAYARDGVHVVHVRLDCALDVPLVRQYYGDKIKPEQMSNTDDVAESYLWVHRQPRSAWSNEIEIRPYTEEWTF